MFNATAKFKTAMLRHTDDIGHKLVCHRHTDAPTDPARDNVDDIGRVQFEYRSGPNTDPWGTPNWTH